MTKMLEGIGKDAEIIINENGGMQSKSPAAMHLIDPKFLKTVIKHANLDMKGIPTAIRLIASYMQHAPTVNWLHTALEELEPSFAKNLFTIGKVLQEGASKYSPNNWRLIPREEHINHALIHLVAVLDGDTQDDHKEHAMCRLMMAIATEETPGFSYTKIAQKQKENEITNELVELLMDTLRGEYSA